MATANLTEALAGKPPPGVIPNFDNPPSVKGELLIVDVVCTTLMGIFVVIRFVSRYFVSKNFGIDDWFCGIAGAASISHAVVLQEQTKYGYGLHLWDIRAAIMLEGISSRIFLANNFPYMACMLCGKLSILLLFSRLFSISPRTKLVILATMVFTTLYTTAILSVSIAGLVECGSAKDMAGDFCVGVITSMLVAQSVMNVVTDFLVLLIPLPMTMALNLPIKRKLAVSSVFLTGLIACAASIGRLVSAVRVLNTNDMMWIQAKSDVFTVIEMNAVVIVSCLLTLPTFLRRCKKWVSKFYCEMKSHVHSSSEEAIKNSPSNGNPGGRMSEEQKDAPKTPKDPYPLITLTNITIMTQIEEAQPSEEEKSVQPARESDELQRVHDVSTDEVVKE